MLSTNYSLTYSFHDVINWTVIMNTEWQELRIISFNYFIKLAFALEKKII